MSEYDAIAAEGFVAVIGPRTSENITVDQALEWAARIRAAAERVLRGENDAEPELLG